MGTAQGWNLHSITTSSTSSTHSAQAKRGTRSLRACDHGWVGGVLRGAHGAHHGPLVQPQHLGRGRGGAACMG